MGFAWQSQPQMTTSHEAAEQLRTIRSIMERATIFRALSGEAALVGGAMSLAAGWLSEAQHGWAWGLTWLGGLGVVLMFFLWQTLRTARAREKPLLSQGLKVALRGALPSLIAGGFLGLLYLKYGKPEDRPELYAAAFWILHYGLALLAIREFAPKSMVWLGAAFVLCGLGCFCAISFVQVAKHVMLRMGPSGVMAATFGGFHLLYGAAIVTTTRRDSPGT
ncbi:MAG: hypothetical protein JWO82_387 [Akkermansiaceae bacterium]|nr:hypothetical protein [Akkermansiaceae bacterium]